MTAAGEVPAAPPGPELQPPKTPRSFGGKSISRFNLFRDPDAPQSSPGSKSPYCHSQATQAQASEQHTPAQLQLQPPPLIPNLVLSANSKIDSTPSLLERRFFGGDLKPPPSPSARSFVSEPGSPLGSHFGTPLSRSASRTEREIDELAAQLDLELDEARRKKAEALQSCQEEDAARCADDVARLEAERELVIDEQRKFDLARLQAQPPSTPSSTKPKRVLEKLNLFSRSARKPSSSNLGQPPLTPLPPATPNSIAPSIFTPTPSIGGRSSLDDSPPFNPSHRMSFIQPHPDGDAPISAINGGERVSARWLAPLSSCDSACSLADPSSLDPSPLQRVTVRCMSSTLKLEVTTETTPEDILIAAAAQTQHDVDVETSVVIECYDALGLDRRMRRYEHVRDTMNSWDRDQDNSLLIVPCDTPGDDDSLELSAVPQTDEPAPGFTIYLYHSPRPGKWSKRYVTLLNTGQMFASKRADAQVGDKDSTSLCHLSDFDIYKPRESEVKRHLKPPKKICYAIKSQQKTVVFPNGENFVHFFCTDDAATAHKFFSHVHAWRSWYIVNKITHSRPVEVPPPLNLAMDIGPIQRIPDKSPRVSSGLTISTGTFIDEADFTKAIEESTRKLALEAELNKNKPRRRNESSASVSPSVKGDQATFSPTGLLGDAYEKRKEEAAAAGEAATDGAAVKKIEGPFTEGPSLLNSMGLSSPKSPEQPPVKSWFPSAAEHSARNRSASISKRPVTADPSTKSAHGKGQGPLLDFANNNFPEPPRIRDGPRHGPGSRQGHGLRPPPGSPLVTFATGGQQAQPASPGGRHRPPPAGGPMPPSGASSSRSRSHSIASANSGASRRHPISADEIPLASSQNRQPGPRSNRMPPHSPRDASSRSHEHRRPGPLLQERQERPKERPRERPQERRPGPLVNSAR
ncbi:uncharacterized protein TRIREDRAFT_108645 [Trichoderma reesei QM6a]|uniref:Predicted protein n=1 Tax=Hypocrea jecorina (strain QM6a) TaxID=431241 RepID=G0RMD6_HYPJQ|nr:uncharacterized protein TRIREDRAFT_108645 [Trichoderma reesei QM6a]EGR47858.1 predicted protein [Trichoderma reesei QM6a]